ncbi:MAG: MFS transporter [Thermodesulfobacteriota bacterium]
MSDHLARKVLTYRWLIFGIMAVAYVFVYFHRLCPAVVANDLQKAFATSGAFMGLLASAYFYPYAIMQLPAGLLSDSLGPRVSVTVFLLLAGVGSILFGFCGNVESAIAARTLVGLGVAMVFIPCMKLQSQWFRVREFATMTAILNTMGGVGGLTAFAPLAWLTTWVGWQGSFKLMGAGTLFIAVLVAVFVRNRPQDMGWPTVAEIDRVGTAPPPPPQTIPLWEGAKRVITTWHFWPMAGWFFFHLGVFFGFGGQWAGPYLGHVYGMPQTEYGSIISMIAVGMIVGSLFLSTLSDRVFHSRKLVIILCTVLALVLFSVLYAYPVGLPKEALYVWFFLFGIASSAVVVIAFTSTKELFPVEIAGTSVGTVNLFPFAGGAVFQPVMGRILDLYPRTAEAYPLDAYTSMLALLLAASVVSLVFSLFLKETFPHAAMARK